MNIQEPLWQKLSHNMRSKHNKQFRDTFFFSVMLLIVHSKLYFKTDILKRKPHGVMQQFGGHLGPVLNFNCSCLINKCMQIVQTAHGGSLITT